MNKVVEYIKICFGRKKMKKPTGQQIIDFLNDKWKSNTCPYCGKQEWNVTESVFELREFNEGNLNVGGPITPVIPITCQNCGNTVFINALTSGLLKE